MPAPKAISQGSNGAGGGAFMAFRGISAAKAVPDTIASAVANKTSFFMTIPIPPYFASPVRRPPRAYDNRLRPNVLTWSYSGLRWHDREAKKASMCRLFRRSDVFDTCSARVFILTTILRVFAPPARYREPEKAAVAPDRRRLFANQLPRENT